ncbi:four helix bundle protein [Xanthomonas dyei]|uniref:Four helix bundle protein n=1 Tax=Xanthomonas dyei TaxID=743699 RepID=A0A2S7C492_9XANT|nr:four helix bundle protein [Xanthomonas dyei]MCC4633921.1 four helix bundle protein [Xanthomonas dyei pv. eucalypti]PPU56389.1 four helix bundle protein [Xanthomonas dyei]WOB28341.1 four helix bundle protein [Xanthomonas dyei]WOB55963.1 four helix bundle protein [Xanthomonas dyei]
MASHFRELEVWQLSMTLAKAVYLLVADFPKEERYGLTSQLQRAAVSIPSNIAEGNARATTRDYARFVSQACGSAAELQTQLLLASDLGLGDQEQIKIALEVCERVNKMLRRLHQALSAKLDPGSPVPGPRSRS